MVAEWHYQLPELTVIDSKVCAKSAAIILKL